MDERRPRHNRGEFAPAAAFAISMAATIALTVVYWRGGQPQAEGIFLAVLLGGIGVGLVLWAKRFMPQGPFTEPRGRLASSEDEIAEVVESLDQGAGGLARRGFLAKMLAAAVGFVGLAALFPVRSLGPRPGRGLKTTGYRKGVRLVTGDNQPVRPAEVNVDGVITVYPEGQTDAGDGPTLLIHLRPGTNRPKPGREQYAAGDLVAYSKLCSHMGCPVGLYQAQSGLLLCPCHQSTFVVAEGCKPIFGPATRSLPQLPIGLDAEGFLVAEGDFSGPVGPGFWDRDR